MMKKKNNNKKKNITLCINSTGVMYILFTNANVIIFYGRPARNATPLIQYSHRSVKFYLK